MPLPSSFLADLREVTRQHNTVLIFDEVVTGFRVSPGGTQRRYGITPDLTSLAKILAGGMPGGAVCGRADIISMIEFRDGRWNAEKRIMHPGTFNANPVSSAAGVAMLSMVKTGEHHKHADALNERLITGLNAALNTANAPGAAYGLASYFHIALGKDLPRPDDGIEWTGEESPPFTQPAVQTALKRAMLNHGVDLMHGEGGFMSGVHDEADIDQTISAFEAAIRELQADGLL
jgi:glutamate-1-semialdehyde 2,1-aminomutase